MTAVVGILNKKAVAIAADSAVSGGGKVLNRALKIFTLSKFEPVGIAIYNHDSYMGTPWETIIKMYRKQLDDTKLDTVENYAQNFIEYLKSTQFFIDINKQTNFLKFNFFNKVLLETVEGAKIQKKIRPEEEIENLITEEFQNYLQNWEVGNNIAGDFNEWTYEDFLALFDEVLNELVSELNLRENIHATQDSINRYKRLLYLITIKWEDYTAYTGLVFLGFGELEIFPSLISVKIHFAIQNRVKFFIKNNESVQITHDMGGAIRPFAQTETMNTILTGIAPNLEDTCIENFRLYIEKYNQRLIQILNPENHEISQIIEAIDINAQTDEFRKKIIEVKRAKYIDPLMDAVATLSKEDLADMAESLIYLTFLQKRITFATEDVGGDVDVAVISKGDGFIWIKRKHYFKKDLNQHFFDNYFNT